MAKPTLNLQKEMAQLAALAAQARQQTTSKYLLDQASALSKAASLLVLAATYSTVSQLVLSPVYGGIPAAAWHSRLVMTACFVGWASNTRVWGCFPKIDPVKAAPVLAAWIPVVQFFLFRLSGVLGSVAGPVVTEALTFAPLLVLSVGSAATILEDVDFSALGRVADAAPGLAAYAFFRAAETSAEQLVMRFLGSSLLFSRVGLQLALSALYALRAPSKVLLYALPALLHTVAFNYHFQGSLITTAGDVLKASNYTLLARRDSNTGYISVLESDENNFRIMRCDHSLLGGNWMPGAPNIPAQKRIVSEPIYGVFAMLEAIRLVELPVPLIDTEANALVIGLGIGTTPSALIAHGIRTTIVEIDPVVFEYAIDYFGLPPNHTPVIQDAVTYTASLANASKSYSYIVHDVFTGGAEPISLFTAEFLSNLHAILAPGGVIAINYAGDLLLPSAGFVVRTITSIFPACRIFRESAAPSPETVIEDGQDFTNMVIFCTKAEGDITFRTPAEKDLLQSGARRMFLMPRHEIPVGSFVGEGEGGVLRKNETGALEKWQVKSARGHWSVMRTVLPGSVWEDW